MLLAGWREGEVARCAADSRVTPPIPNGVENGEPGLLYQRLCDIAEAVGVPANELLVDT